MYSPAKIIQAISFALLSCFFMCTLTEGAEFVYAKKANGEDSLLTQKLVTVKRLNPIWDTPDQNARSSSQVSAYNVFHQLKTEGGSDVSENGEFYRIGNSEGDPLGWIEKDSVQTWGTRYVIKPQIAKGDSIFTVKRDQDGMAFGYTAKENKSSITSYCFILDAPEGGDVEDSDGPFHVSFCLQQVASATELKSRQQVADMSLEIAFVVEDMKYLTIDFGGQRTVAESLHGLAESLKREFADENIPVNFGLIRTADSHPACSDFQKAEVVTRLTPDLNAWSSDITQIIGQTVNGGSDRENDGLSGVDLAINKLNWRSDGNSAKHIIYIGFAPFQKYGFRQKGSGAGGPPESIPDPSHYLSFIYNRDNPSDYGWRQLFIDPKTGGDEIYEGDVYWTTIFGTNQSRKWIDQIVGEAFRAGGNVGAEHLRKRHLHAVHIGARREDVYTANQIALYEKADQVVQENFVNLSSEKKWDFFTSDTGSSYIEPCLAAYWMTTMPAYEEAAIKQFKQLSSQGKSNAGYYSRLDPNNGSGEIQRITKELSTIIREGVELVADVGKGKTIDMSKRKSAGAIAAPIFEALEMDEADKSPVDPDRPVEVGLASMRSPKTKKYVAEKRVMVSQKEIRTLAQAFENIYEDFQSMGDEELQDTEEVLDRMKRSLGSAVAGQNVDKNSNIQDLVTDLPLQTQALNISPNQIAVMSSKSRAEWIEDLKVARDSLNDLTKDQPGSKTSRWTEITSLGGKPEYFSFLAFHQLP